MLIINKLPVVAVIFLITFIPITSQVRSKHLFDPLIKLQVFIFWPWLSFSSKSTAFLWLAPYNVAVLSIWVNYYLGCITPPGHVPKGYDPRKDESRENMVVELKKIINLILLFLLTFTVGLLSLWQLYFSASNTTTIENSENNKIDDLVRMGKISSDSRYPYDLGWFRNLQAVLGKNVLLWWMPQAAEGDGIHYAVNPKLDGGEEKRITWPPAEYYEYRHSLYGFRDEDDGSESSGERDGIPLRKHIRRGSEGYLVRELTQSERERLVFSAERGGDSNSEVGSESDSTSDNEPLSFKLGRYESRQHGEVNKKTE
ncbi:Palmitoyltransferase [Irineochytrium annulatum]|nr:Palmitoyltransferase [Irineochytrium annulatum]